MEEGVRNMNLSLRKYIAGASLAAALALGAAGCDLDVTTPTPAVPGATATTAAAPTTAPTSTTEPAQATATSSGQTLPTPEVTEPGITPVVRAAIRFADYNLESTTINPSLDPYKVQPGLANVENADAFDISAGAKTLIEQNAFAAQFPSGEQYLQFYQLYEDGRYSEKPVFVTTDSLLHVYHLMFDKVLRTTETKYLIADLHQLNAAMLEPPRTPPGATWPTSWWCLACSTRRRLSLARCRPKSQRSSRTSASTRALCRRP
jgi:hypothetical protein